MVRAHKFQNLIFKAFCWAQNKPARMICISFLFVIGVGSALLTLPAATLSGESAGLLKAAFTATSATCVTGLVVVDTATYWSLFGKLVIIALIQVGGLGLVTITTFFFTILKRRMALRTMTLAQECSASFSLPEVKSLVVKIIGVTFTIELIGSVILSARFIPHFGVAGGIFRGFFQGVSAFCNAGFDLMGDYTGPYTSLTKWVDDPIVLYTTALLIICGGLGFIVWSDMLNFNKQKGLNFHSKLVLKMTTILIVSGTVFFLIAEWNNMTVDSLGNLNFFQKIDSAFFQSVTTRTAGFNSISQSNLTDSSKIFSSILMFIGASSGSTGGGIKVTTFSMLFFFILSELRGDSDTIMLKRRIPKSVATRSISIALLAALLVITDTMLLSVFERSGLKDHLFSTLDLLFESVSAFGTVGLSSANTPVLHPNSHIVLIITMYIGRVGPASLALAFAGRKLSANEKIYPEAKVLVG